MCVRFSSSSSKEDFIHKVKELRKLTSAPIMDCKNALEQHNGDIREAQVFLVKKGLSQMEKLQDRVTGQGSIWISTDLGRAALIEMNCQTDFVSSNESFMSVLKECTSSLLRACDTSSPHWISHMSGEYTELKGADIPWLLTLPFSSSETINDAVAQLNYTTGEKVEITRASVLLAPRSILGSYIHQGRIGSLVSLSLNTKDYSQVPESDLQDFSRKLAVHVAGFQPSVIGHADLASLHHDNRSVGETGVDAEALGDKVADDLMSQPFNIAGGGTVASHVMRHSQKLGVPLHVTSFVRWELGGREGIAGFRDNN